MKSKQITIASLVAAGAIAGIALSSVGAIAKDVTQGRDLKAFTKVLVEGAMSVTIEAGKKQSVEVTTEDSHIDRVETTVEGDTLVISMTGRKWRNADVDVSISVKELNGFDIEGAADAHITGVKSDSFALQIDGAGDIFIDGTCGSLDIELNGAGDINTRDFKCQDVKIVINGAGDAEVYASRSVEAQINGVGDIDVYGDPDKVRPRISGLGDFEVK